MAARPFINGRRRLERASRAELTRAVPRAGERGPVAAAAVRLIREPGREGAAGRFSRDGMVGRP